MHVVPIAEAQVYEAPGHAHMLMRRLQGMEAGPSDSVWIGLSVIEPGGGTNSGASAVEKFYVCLEGAVEVTASRNGSAHTVVLHPLDSCRIEPNEERQLANRTHAAAKLLLVMPRRS